MAKHKFELDETIPAKSAPEELEMLDALLCAKKLWDYKVDTQAQKKAMRRIHNRIRKEHEYMLEHEPADEFHACVLLGALNIVKGLLKE